MSEEFENDGPYQDAQSAEELERYVMGSTFPKTPAEWWACREIDRLRARIAELEAALKAFEKYQTEYPDEYSKHPIIGAFLNELRAASAALNGEKG